MNLNAAWFSAFLREGAKEIFVRLSADRVNFFPHKDPVNETHLPSADVYELISALNFSLET